jgi:hypothetical protein
MINVHWESATAGIKSPIRLRNGVWMDMPGTYWAWPVDGYYDLHFAERGIDPDGSDEIVELLPTLKAARDEARDLNNDSVFHAKLKQNVGG